MTEYAVWDLVIVGGMSGLALRWLLSIDIEMHWAAGAGAAIMLLQPWATSTFGALLTSHSLPSIVIGGGVAVALVAAVQSINSH